jgi:hypothetical protein
MTSSVCKLFCCRTGPCKTCRLCYTKIIATAVSANPGFHAIAVATGALARCAAGAERLGMIHSMRIGSVAVVWLGALLVAPISSG